MRALSKCSGGAKVERRRIGLIHIACAVGFARTGSTARLRLRPRCDACIPLWPTRMHARFDHSANALDEKKGCMAALLPHLFWRDGRPNIEQKRPSLVLHRIRQAGRNKAWRRTATDSEVLRFIVLRRRFSSNARTAVSSGATILRRHRDSMQQMRRVFAPRKPQTNPAALRYVRLNCLPCFRTLAFTVRLAPDHASHRGW
jgi:hypothetical protein